jgi:cytochrome c oxidase subunit 2
MDVANALDPAGHGAVQIANIWWVLLIIATVVYIVVMGILYFTVTRRRRSETDVNAPPPRGSQTFILVSGVVIPAIILSGVFVLTLITMRNLTPAHAAQPLTIHVTGRMWWWEVEYRTYEIITANEIHIPVGEPVSIALTSADVTHAFWVPELHGKLNLYPNRTNTITIQANEPGIYRGVCAEFCGIQHTYMGFYVVAHEEERFAAWVEQQQQPAHEPEPGTLAEQGRDVFLSANCVYCHAIEGTSAEGRVGPDLTHIASRLSLGAGAVPNTEGHLGGWIVNSQSIKPGNHMPPVALESQDLIALIAYLSILD